MKLENIDGMQYIFLEENDNISLIIEDAYEYGTIDVECENGGLNISGNSLLINKISGDGMLEKVVVLPFTSSESIIEKCDQWLEMFRKVHDKFRGLVLEDRYRKQNITMDLSFYEFFALSNKNSGKRIDLNLKQNGTIIQEGITITIDENNETVYKYLFANVLDHYLSVNYEDSAIENIDFWNPTLYSNYENKSTVPVICELNSLYGSDEYARIVTSIITNHNLGQSSEQIIGNLRNAICNQQLRECFNRSIDHSSEQYAYIISDSDSKKTHVLEKKKTN